MTLEHFALLISALSVIALLTAIAKLGSTEKARSSQTVRLDPMDWHPGRFFPPALSRMNQEGARPTGVSQDIGNCVHRVGGEPRIGSMVNERRDSSRVDPTTFFGRLAQEREKVR